MRRSSALIALALATLLAPADARAGRFAVALAFEAWPDDAVPGHGIALLSYDFDPWIGDSRPSVVLNTDTLRLGLHDLRIGEAWRLGFEAAGEYGVAGLLTDYYVDGEAVPARGFAASYVEAGVRLKRLLPRGAWAELTVHGRRWFFDRRDETADDLRLPPEAWVLMPRLHLGLWRLADDAGFRDRHRLFPRLRGFAVGIEGGVDLRSDDRAWGGIGRPSAGDGRNDGGGPILLVRQWMRVGVPLGERVRVEVEEHAAYGVEEDDLTRVRIGGMNPYVVALPGAPWAAWLSEHVVSARLALPIRIVGDVELAPTASAIMLRDPGRVGSDQLEMVVGAGGAIDARFGDWQVDLRGGVSPTIDTDEERVGWSAYLGVGWGR